MNKKQHKRKKSMSSTARFRIWSTFLGMIILVMSVNLLTFVQGIQVKNNVNASSKDLIAWATKDNLSFNTLYLWYKINHTEIEYPVSIVDAHISFQNPWTLTLRVIEKEILGGLILNDNYVYFDQDGQVLLITKMIQENIRLLDGIIVTEANLYEPLATKNNEGFNHVLEVMNLIDKYQVEIDHIVPDEDGSVSLIIGSTTVLLGMDNYEAKVPHISPILERLEEKEGTLYLENFDGDNGTITFK